MLYETKFLSSTFSSEQIKILYNHRKIKQIEFVDIVLTPPITNDFVILNNKGKYYLQKNCVIVDDII